MFRPNVLERGTLDFWGSKFSRKSVHISGWGHRNVPPKKYFPQIFFLEIGGGSKHVLGRGRQFEGVNFFFFLNFTYGLFRKKMFFLGISTMAVKNINVLKIVTEVKYPVVKVTGQRRNLWVSRSARSVSNGFSW